MSEWMAYAQIESDRYKKMDKKKSPQDRYCAACKKAGKADCASCSRNIRVIEET
jgi:hypothetical protein